MLVIPSFLRVTPTVTSLAVVSFNPENVIVSPPLVIETWSEVKGSIEPSWYVIEYFYSNGRLIAKKVFNRVSSPEQLTNYK